MFGCNKNWFHTWGKWTTVSSKQIFAGPLWMDLDTEYTRAYLRVIQKRTCVNCGFEQYNTQETSV